MTVSGQFTLNGTPTAGAKITIIDTDATPSSVVGTATTDANGDWGVDVGYTTTLHALLEYKDPDTGELHQSHSKPFVHHESTTTEPAFWSEALHRYNHNEGSGTTITDTGAAASLADATITGGVWDSTTFKYEGTSVSYDGVDDSSAVPNRSTLTGFDTGMTIVTWVYPSSTTVRQDFIDGPGYALRIDTNWQVYLYHADGTFTRYNFTGGPAPIANGWNRIGFRWTSGNHIDLFHNGTIYAGADAGLGGAGTPVASVQSSTSSLYFSDPGQVYGGLMDGPVMVWNRALTDQEILDDYNAFA